MVKAPKDRTPGGKAAKAHADPAAVTGTGPDVPRRRITWRTTYRLVPSRFPPIDLFERVADPADWEMLYALESLTNPRLRDEVGSIRMVPEERRVSGQGSTVVMAPFTHVSPNRASRFTDGTYGVYYAAKAFTTALLEVAFHMARFHAATRDPPLTDTFRSYKGQVDATLADIRGGAWPHLLSSDTNDYGSPQAFAKALREGGCDGIVYPSVRHAGGECLAAFWPDVVTIPVQDRHVQLRWDGTAVSGWLDYHTDDAPGMPRWRPIDG